MTEGCDGRAEPPCRDVVERVNDYLEGELSPHDTEAFDEHVSRCPGCRSYVTQMHLTVRIASRGRT